MFKLFKNTSKKGKNMGLVSQLYTGMATSQDDIIMTYRVIHAVSPKGGRGIGDAVPPSIDLHMHFH